MHALPTLLPRPASPAPTGVFADAERGPRRARSGLALALLALAGLAFASACSRRVLGETVPVADAGPDARLVFREGLELGLAGGARSTGPIARWLWRISAAPPSSGAVLVSPDSRSTVFRPDGPGSYVLSLEVEDELGARSPPDYALVEVLPAGAAPGELTVSAVATVGGVPRSAFVGETIELSAVVRGLTVEDGEVTWSWLQLSGPETLEIAQPRPDDASALVAAVLPSGVDQGFYELEVSARTSTRQAATRLRFEVARASIDATLTCEVDGLACADGVAEGATAALTLLVTAPAGAAPDEVWRVEVLQGADRLETALATVAPQGGGLATLVLPRVRDTVELGVYVVLTDPTAGSRELGARVRVNNTDRAPPTAAVELVPSTYDAFLLGDRVRFSATVEDPDTTAPDCLWTVSGIDADQVVQPSGDCTGFSARVLSAGTLTARLSVSDRDHPTVVAEASVEVAGPRLLSSDTTIYNGLAVAPSGNVYFNRDADIPGLRTPAGQQGRLIGGLGEGDAVAVEPSGAVWLTQRDGNRGLVQVVSDLEADAVAPFFAADEVAVYDEGGACHDVSVDGGGGVTAVCGDGADAVLFHADAQFIYPWLVPTEDSLGAVVGWTSAGTAFFGCSEALCFAANLDDGAGLDPDARVVLASLGGGGQVQRLVRGRNAELWVLTLVPGQTAAELFLLDAANPTGPQLRLGSLSAATVVRDGVRAAVAPAAEPSGSAHAGELWLPAAESGVARVDPTTGQRFVLDVPLQHQGLQINYRTARVHVDGSSRSVLFGTREGLWVMP